MIKKLLDGKWEPYTFICDQQKEIERHRNTIRLLNGTIGACEAEIARARAFLTENEKP